MSSPRDFTLIVQGPGPGRRRCLGAVVKDLSVPTRVLVLADHGAHAAAVDLTEDLVVAMSALGAGVDACGGPTGLGCWATDSPVAQHLVVVVSTGRRASSPTSRHIEETVVEMQGRPGFQVVGLVPAGVDPQAALPPSLRSTVVLRYVASSTEVTTEVLDLALLGGEERRAFISYAHADGAQHASDVFDVLARRQFDVYLDRFRTAPATNFVERIDDELRDKAMVVLIETPRSVRSAWVWHEVMVARMRGYGLLALRFGGAPRHPMIGDEQRLSLPTFDGGLVAAAVERHHRAAVVAQRRHRRDSIRWALRHAVRRSPLAASVEVEGDRCDLVGTPVEYSVLGSFRPPGLRQARLVDEAASPPGRRPVLQAPRPTALAARRDVGWIDGRTPVAVVPDGLLLPAALDMVAGRL